MVHLNLMFNNLNMMCYSDLDQFLKLHMRTYRNCYMLFPALFKLALMCGLVCIISCHEQHHVALSCVILC